MSKVSALHKENLRFSMAPAVVLLPQPESVPTGLAVVRGLGRNGIPVVAVGGEGVCPSFASRYATVRLRSPNYRVDANEWLNWLVTLGERVSPQPVLYATSDGQVALLSRYYEELSRHFAYPYVGQHTLKACLDKAATFAVGNRVGVAQPRTLVLDRRTQIMPIVQKASVPAVVKPSTWVISDDHGVRHDRKFSNLFGNKAIRVSNREQLSEILAAAMSNDLTVLIQEEIVGPGSQLYAVGLYCDRQSTPRAVFVGRKLRQYPSDFGSGTMCEGASHDGIVEASIQLISEIEYSGIAEIEWKLGGNDRYYLIEINPRPWVWLGASEVCGVNLALIMYCDLNHLSVPEHKQSNTGVKWIDFWRDLEYFYKYRRGDHLGKKMTLIDYLRSISGPKEYAYGTPDDRGPGRVRLRMKLREIASRLMGKLSRR